MQSVWPCPPPLKKVQRHAVGMQLGFAHYHRKSNQI